MPHKRDPHQPFNRFEACKTPGQLYCWIKDHAKLRIPTRSVCAHHAAPFEYLRQSYFEPANDLVVWAPRGGGKTRLAALATLLDLLHKPGISVRILGGSLAQSLRMWEHLVPDLERIAEKKIDRLAKGGWVRMKNGAHAAAIPQSQRAVRGLHVQKLRCDEVELFDPAVFEAAKLATRSMRLKDQSVVKGTIEALSTLHAQWGLMNQVIEAATSAARPVIKWCILDVLETCPPERECPTCPLWDDCGGRAKYASGFVPIDDAIQLKARASRESWEAEMLCKRPSAKGAVFPGFNHDVHVRDIIQGTGLTPTLQLAIDFGFRNPFVCLWIADDGQRVHVIDEYVQVGRTLDEHLEVIESRPWGLVRVIACDPAGNARNDQTAESNVQLLRRRQYVIRSKPSRIVDGLELIRRGLKTGTGATSLLVHPRCVNLIRALRGYHYPKGHGGSELPFKDGEHDHLIDALRYFYVNRVNREGLEAMKSRQY